MLTTEEWRLIPGFPGYEASTTGCVRSVERRVSQVRYGKIHYITKPATVLATRDQSGYSVVQLRRADRRPTAKVVSRLVLMAFTGEDIPGLDCCHINGDRQDNRPENLRWGTRQENVDDMLRHGTHPSQRLKTHCPSGHKYTPSNTGRRKDGSRRCRACDREYHNRVRPVPVSVDPRGWVSA